ncbi:MAG: PAS domain-containing protein [Candidatus Margulisiibacteriota bacterium]
MVANQKKEELYNLLELEVSELEDYINDLWEFNPIPMAYINPIGIIMDADISLASLLGIDREDIIGSRLEDYSSDKKELLRIKNETLKQGSLKNQEITLLGREKKEIPIYLSSTARKDTEGNIVGYFVSLSDMSERKKAEKKTKESEEKFRRLSKEQETILDFFPGLIFYKDMKNNFIRVNKYVAEAHKMDKTDLEGKNLFDLYPKDQAQAYWDDDLKVLKSGIPKINFEEPWETAKGIKWVLTSKIPFVDEHGQIIGILGISMDITERKQAEKKLQEKMQELEEFHDLAVGRELKMIELENEVNALLIELGRKPKYKEEPS